MMGRLQFWLQGHPNKQRPWVAIWLGNRLSDGRYWLWRARGGKYPTSKHVGPFVTIDPRYPSATSNQDMSLNNNEINPLT